ncbi:hypothetical protein GCM10027570_52680 [Streptomonospora sediminis]
MTDFAEFYEFDTAVLAADERGDPAAACELVLAAGDFRRTVRHLRTLPEDARRRLAHTCVELYKTAESQEHRDRIRAMHAGLLARRVDLLETDGFEASVLATMHSGERAYNEKREAMEGVLASAEFPRLVERLRAFHPEHRRPLADHVLQGLYERSQEPQQRERILWLSTALADRPELIVHRKRHQVQDLVREAVEGGAPAANAAVFESSSLTRVARRLVRLPRDVRLRLDRHCAGMLEAADTQERRESVIWMRAALTSGPLKYFGYDELEPMLSAAAERGDAAAACEAVVADTDFAGVLNELARLPKGVRRSLVEACVDLHGSDADADRRFRILRMHAFLARSLGKPDDRLAAARQEALRFDPGDTLRRWRSIDMVWVELSCGRDLPGGLRTELRRERYEGGSWITKDLRKMGALLTGQHPVLNPGEPWSDQALADLAHLPAVWTDLVRHTLTAAMARPNTAWETKARTLLAEVDGEEFRDLALSWLAAIQDPRKLPAATRRPPGYDAYNHQAARGLVWLVSFLPEHPHTAHGLSALLEKAVQDVPDIGPGMPKLANACAMALCTLEGKEALAEAARLAAQVAYKPTRKLLEEGLNARAQALGVSRADLG